MGLKQWGHECVRYEGRPQQGLAVADPPLGERYLCGEVRRASRSPLRSPAEDRRGNLRTTGAAGAGPRWARTRRRKVQAIRRQIEQGTYDVNARLAAILNQIVEGLVAQAEGGPRRGSARARRRPAGYALVACTRKETLS